MKEYDIHIYKGASWEQVLKFPDAINLDSATAKSHIRETQDGPRVAALTCTVDAVAKTVRQMITDEESLLIPVTGGSFGPRLCFWDVFITLANGRTLPPVRGRAFIYPGATHD